MNEAAIIKETLLTNFPHECEVLGESVVSDLVDGQIEFEAPDVGRAMTFDQVFKTLADGLLVIKLLLDLYESLKRKLGRPPTSREVNDDLKSKDAPPLPLNEKKIEDMVESVVTAKQREDAREREQ